METQTPVHGKENVRFLTPKEKTPFTGIKSKTGLAKAQTAKSTTKTPLKDTTRQTVLGEKTNVATPRHGTPLLRTVLQRTARKETVKKGDKSAKLKRLVVFQDPNSEDLIEYCPPPAIERRNLFSCSLGTTRRSSSHSEEANRISPIFFSHRIRYHEFAKVIG
jgi:hypothetical protein